MKKLVLLFAVLLQSGLSFGQNYRNTAELFIEVPDEGNYVVNVDNDFVGSSKNRFRFFEVGTFPTVTITKDNVALFRKQIRLQPNTRFIASFSRKSGWRPMTTLPMFDHNQYILDNWNGRINVDNAVYDDRMDEQEFAELLSQVNKEPFPSNKLSLIKTALKGSLITTDQLISLTTAFDFDDKKMEIAKYAYDSILDKRKYFRVAEIFTFQSSKAQILSFINSKNP